MLNPPRFRLAKGLSISNIAAMEVLGIDIGGSGLKAAVIDISTGELVTERLRFPTGENATTEMVMDQVVQATRTFNWNGLIGCGFPGVIRDNIICTAANLDDSWVGVNLASLIRKKTGCKTASLNDGDAAGVAEMRLGAGKGRNGVVILITVGTGLGTALFSNGVLVPNTEFGHILMKGKAEAEDVCSDRIRKAKGLSWKQWSQRFNQYLTYLESLFWPDLFIIGGGGAKKPERYMEHLELRTEVQPAHFKNKAGMIGAALYAKETFEVE